MQFGLLGETKRETKPGRWVGKHMRGLESVSFWEFHVLLYGPES